MVQFTQVVPVADCVLLRDEDMAGGQDFFNDTPVGIGAKLVGSQPYHLFLDQPLDDFGRKSAFPQGWLHPNIQQIPKTNQRYHFVIINHLLSRPGLAHWNQHRIVLMGNQWGVHPMQKS